MAGFIIIKDRNIWGPARWVYNRLTDDIIKQLNDDNHQELKTLISRTKENYTHLIDIEKLSLDNKMILYQAINDVVKKLELENGQKWDKPEFFEGYKSCVLELNKLIEDSEKNIEIDFHERPKYIFSGKKNDI